MARPCPDCGGPKPRNPYTGRISNLRCEPCEEKHRVTRYGPILSPRERRAATSTSMKAAWARRKAQGEFRTVAEKRIRDLATKYVRAAIKAGFLAPVAGQACADCGKPAECYDHRDYSQPLLVVAVCLPCNASRRKGLMPARIVDTQDAAA